MTERSMRRTGVLAAVAFLGLTLDVKYRGRLDRTERRLVRHPAGPAGPWPTLTRIGDRPALATMTIAAAAISLVRQHPPSRAVLPVVVGVPLRVAVMQAVDRHRPPSERWLVEPTGASYPSRHATSGALGLLALRRALPASRLVNVGCLALIAVEGYSRVRLGVHWPSDVAGGVLLACAVESLTR